jgi:hypothetical protein
VDELGDASVPFKFDVHSFIFSEDAVDLETKLHKELESKRSIRSISKKSSLMFLSMSLRSFSQGLSL